MDQVHQHSQAVRVSCVNQFLAVFCHVSQLKLDEERMTPVCLQLIWRTKPAGWGEKAGDLVAWNQTAIESVAVTESLANRLTKWKCPAKGYPHSWMVIIDVFHGTSCEKD